jgi:hypothetical protein
MFNYVIEYLMYLIMFISFIIVGGFCIFMFDFILYYFTNKSILVYIERKIFDDK